MLTKFLEYILFPTTPLRFAAFVATYVAVYMILFWIVMGPLLLLIRVI